MRFLFILTILWSASSAFAHDLCDRQSIQKAIQQAKASQEASAFAKSASVKIPRPGRKSLSNVLNKIESSIFGRKVLRIQEDLPMIPPMATFGEGGIITISPQTVDSLNRKCAQPTHGAAFIIAHEIGHFVQDISLKHSAKKLSPSGFKYAAPQQADDYNQLHAETDCIAVEILHQAGYPITNDIYKTLQIIKEECKTQREEKFCESADEIRTSTVRNFIQKYYKSDLQDEFTSTHPKNKTDRQPASNGAQ